MKTKLIMAAAVLATGMTLVGCHSNKSAEKAAPQVNTTTTSTAAPAVNNTPSVDLAGTWKITQLNGKAMVQDEDGAPSIAFLPAEGRFSCQTGCNMLGGDYEITATGITFKPGMQTMMSCPDMSVEETLKQVLPNVKTMVATDGGYSFCGADGAVIFAIAK